MKHVRLLLSLFSLLVCISVSANTVQHNPRDCQLPDNLDNKFHVTLHECMQPLNAEDIPVALRENNIDRHPNAQAVNIHFNNPKPISQKLVLSLGIPDAFNLVVWQVNKDGSQKLLQLNEHSSFYDRQILHRSLQVNVDLAPAQTTEWYIFYRTQAKAPLYLELLDAKQNLLIQSHYDLINGFIFGIMLMLILIIVLLLFFYKAKISYGFYVVLVFSNLLFIAQIDGYTFAYLWPEHPQWNMNAPIFFNLIIIASHILFTINYLQLSWRYPRLYKIYLLMLGLGFLIIPLQFIVSVEKLYAAFMVTYFLLAVFTAWRAMREQVAAAKFYFFGTLSLMMFSVVLFSIGMLWRNIFPDIDILTFPKIGIILETFFFMLTLLSQLLDFNRRQTELHLNRLTETEQLLKAEQARTQALALAEQRQLQLASASHDISQPLASIRFAMSALQFSDDQKTVTKHIDKTLFYAQTLLTDILDQSKKEWGITAEKISLPILFDQLQHEFKSQADAKKLQLNIIYSHLECSGSSLLLYRILNNLLANAIRYTNKGRICLGVRRRKLGIELQIGDTGPGIPQPLINSLTQPFQQGEQSQQGYGLGLFIVRTLCHQCGYHFSLRSKQGVGTLFSIYIPFSDL